MQQISFDLKEGASFQHLTLQTQYCLRLWHLFFRPTIQEKVEARSQYVGFKLIPTVHLNCKRLQCSQDALLPLEQFQSVHFPVYKAKH